MKRYRRSEKEIATAAKIAHTAFEKVVQEDLATRDDSDAQRDCEYAERFLDAHSTALATLERDDIETAAEAISYRFINKQVPRFTTQNFSLPDDYKNYSYEALDLYIPRAFTFVSRMFRSGMGAFYCGFKQYERDYTSILAALNDKKELPDDFDPARHTFHYNLKYIYEVEAELLNDEVLEKVLGVINKALSKNKYTITTGFNRAIFEGECKQGIGFAFKWSLMIKE